MFHLVLLSFYPIFVPLIFVCIVGTSLAASVSYEVEILIKEHRWNQAVMLNLVDDYEIVYPFQVRDRNRVGIDTRNYYFANATIHFDRCTFVVKSSYSRFKLHLEQNRLLIPFSAKYKQNFNDTHSTEFRGEFVEHCYYQGEVHSEENSRVAMSTCDGLRGVIITGNQTYFILPLEGGDLGRRHPHVLLRAKWHQKLNCAVHGSTEWGLTSSRKYENLHGKRQKRDSTKGAKFVELALIADSKMYSDFDGKFVKLLRYILEAVNGMDLLMSELNTRISLVRLDVWTGKSPVQLNDDITQSMLNFVQFASTTVYSENTDAMLFITSEKFLRQESSHAIMNSVCTARAAGIVSNPNRFEEHQLSVIMTHSVSHILGMKHDTADETCSCDDKFGCMMSSSLSGKRQRFLNRFSSCSKADYTEALTSSQTRCLFNRPLEDSNLVLCGNRIIDPGEQCDCGSVEECDSVDRCCDPVTCTLKEGAECGAGECCQDCKLLQNSHVCRVAIDECDVPETCNGKSGRCPADARHWNGEECDKGSGICYNGRCSSAKAQCVELWGPDATLAERECFEKFNSIGIENGNCGYDEKGQPRSCKAENAYCGLLHCKGGIEKPPAPSYYKLEFSWSGKPYECKTVTSGTNVTYLRGMIKNGSRCGPNKWCVNSSCVDITDTITEAECPTNNVALPCSGHGICTTENTCYCNAGWAGDDCGKKSDTNATLPSRSAPDSSGTHRFDKTNHGTSGYHLNGHGQPVASMAKMDTYTLLIILGGVAGAVFVILLLSVLCYRRQTRTNLAKKNLKKKECERESESSADTANRSIRFGSMPSYRGEKMQMKQKKRILHQIKEVGDEKDSVSNKSRDSSHSMALAAAAAAEAARASYGNLHDNSYTDRSILKNGSMMRCSLSDMEQCSPLLRRPSDGYESEPPSYVQCKVFQNSLRRLNECEIYRMRSPSDEIPAKTSSSSYSMQQPQRPMGAGIPIDDQHSLEYSNEQSNNCSYQTRTGSPPPETNASVKNGWMAARSQPLQLKNIQYLLRQLDQNCVSNQTGVSVSSSTSDMSAPEADKVADDHNEEAGSNTESHRDAGYLAKSASGCSSTSRNGTVLPSIEHRFENLPMAQNLDEISYDDVS